MTVPAYLGKEDCRIEEFRSEIDRTLAPEDVPNAARIASSIPVYHAAALLPRLQDPVFRRTILAEWVTALADGAGVLVLEGACEDLEVVDRVSAVYRGIISREAAAGAGKADHFAAAGANARIWNSAQKLCEADPEAFALYFGNEAINAVAEAWLGPGYQMTAQVNVVRPGGAAQEAHRDYHLGFQTAAAAAMYPAHVHALSPVLTLQGGVAHCDMPLESGPTKLLPFSQGYLPGYLAYRLPEFRALFEERAVQFPLAKGDAIFFNPALFHAAGENRSEGIERMANLLQVSSPFGRAMESLDRTGMCRRLYPELKRLLSRGALGKSRANAAIAAAAEGYSFPTNLDTDPPEGGLAPQTQADVMRRALEEGLESTEFEAALARLDARRAAVMEG